MSNRGGARPGAGRKKGPAKATLNRRSIAEKSLESGLTPLEYMMTVLRSEFPPELKERIESEALSVDLITAISAWHAQRFEAAKAAAPYVHPRLAAIEHSGGIDLGLKGCSDAELDAAIQRAAKEASVDLGPSRKGAQKQKP